MMKMKEMMFAAKVLADQDNAVYVEPIHIFAAICKHLEEVSSFFTVYTDYDFVENFFKDEFAKCEKLTSAIIQGYKSAKVNRTIRSSELTMRCIEAASIFSMQNVRKTESFNTDDLDSFSLGITLLAECKFDAMFDGNEQAKLLFLYELSEDGQTGDQIDGLNISDDEHVSQSAEEHSDQAKKDEMKVFKSFCADLLEAAAKDDKPFVGRENEIMLLMQCLSRKDKPNAILTGAPGVGKTDIVRGLAKKMVENNVPGTLRNVKMFAIDLPGMLAGTKYRGEFEDRLKKVLNVALSYERPILFIDEIHSVLGAGATMENAMDAANILKPYLTDGEIRVIGATTEEEFRKHIENDSAFMRRFQKIAVEEPSAEETIEILKIVKNAYEVFHHVKIADTAIKSAVTLSVKHMHDRFLPDKAIDIVDQACACVKLKENKQVTSHDIEEIVAKICHVPVTQVSKDELEKVRSLDTELKKHVFGQNEAIEKVTEAVQMSKAGLNDPNKPIGSFMFVGPSGVGKTEIAKQLANVMGLKLIRFDMSEYMEPNSAAKLIGAPAGYVGYEDGGILVEAVRQTPNCVLLFDEIEKAHHDVYKTFLQMLDYGMLTDNKGRKADFRNTIIIMTSNAGNTVVQKPQIGFGVSNPTNERNKIVMQAVSELMPPELRGRIGSIISFNPITNDIAKMIVKKELGILNRLLKAKGISVTYSDQAINEIVARGVSAEYGAREIQGIINKMIKPLFVKQIISGGMSGKYQVEFDNSFVIKNVKAKELVQA